MGLIVGPPLVIRAGGGGGKNVQYLDPVEAEYTKRVAGGGASIGKGKAKIDKVKGKTLVWNQMLKTLGDADIKPGSSNTITYTGNGAQITSLAAYSPWRFNCHLKDISGHKALLSIYLEASNDVEINVQVSGSYVNITSGVTRQIRTISIIDPSSTYADYISLYSATLVENISIKDFQFIDLTAMFGAGNEPSTVAEFEALYPLPYYAYNAGTLINNAATGIETVGFNQWDEEVEDGGIYVDNGQNSPTSGFMRSKNYIPVFGGVQYFIKSPVTMVLFFYDQSKQLISLSGNSSFTTPSNAAYLRFRNSVQYSWSTYNHDICINISDASRNGEYQPYQKDTVSLNLSSLTGKKDGTGSSVVVFPDGLKSAGSVYDEIQGNRAIKRIGKVDLGTLEWTYSSNRCRSTDLASLIAIPETTTVMCEITAQKYRSIKFADGLANNHDGITIVPANQGSEKGTLLLYAADSSDTPSGWMHYELAEPETYVLDQKPGNKYKVEPGGTEERLPADTSDSVNAPIRYDVEYVKP